MGKESIVTFSYPMGLFISITPVFSEILWSGSSMGAIMEEVLGQDMQ
jgi:hypothetical protein